MKITASYITHVGKKNKHNEDSLLLMDKFVQDRIMLTPKIINIEKINHAMFAIADGIGGLSGGEIASAIVLKYLKDKWKKVIPMDQKKICNLIQQCQLVLNKYAENNSLFCNLGTTIAGIWFNCSHGIIFNVGDSRIYRVNHGYLEQLSKDQSLVQSLVDNRIILPEEIKKNPYKHVILESISANSDKKEVKVRFKSIKIKENDVFIICSDGLTDVLDLNEMEQCLVAELNTSTDNLFKSVAIRGIKDDISIIMIKIISLDIKNNE